MNTFKNLPYPFVSYEGEFNTEIDNYLVDIDTKGFDYNVVSILGCQSSGKSTLLNEVFGTQFEVMDSLMGRSQTTKGLWISQDAKNEENQVPMLIIDVEGTDSKERGEDRASFEHRASLFALALSDLVVINMWYTDLGRYTASNYGLLRTVLQVNLELFGKDTIQKKTTTRLVFIIRDYSPLLTPMEKLEEMLFTDVRNLWNEIEKPPGLENSKASDFFSFACVGLASRVMQKEQFIEDVKLLRSQIRDDWVDREYTKKIPFDGFQAYTASIWNAIISSSDLDIPSQKAMLATFRCEELKSEAMRVAKNTLELSEIDYENVLMEPPFTALNGVIDRLIQEAMSLYDEHGYRYDTTIFEQIRADLIHRLSELLQQFLSVRISPIVRRTLLECQADLEKTLSEMIVQTKDGLPDGVMMEQLPGVLNDWKRETREALMTAYGGLTSLIPPIAASLGDRAERLTQRHPEWTEPSHWTFDVTDIIQSVSEKQEIQAEQEFERLRDKFLVDLNRAFNELVWPASGVDDALLDRKLNGKDFWVKLNDILAKITAEFQPKYGSCLAELSSSEYGVKHKTAMSLSAMVALSLRRYIKQLATNGDRLVRIVTDRFDMAFYDDDEGVPRNWASVTFEEIGSIYKASRDGAYMVLDDLSTDNLLHHDTLDEPVVLEGMKADGGEKWEDPIVDTGRKGVMTDRASRHMKRAVTDAQAINATGGKSLLPGWPYWVAVAILGYNEFIALISSPFMLMGILLLVVVLAGAHFSGNIKNLHTIAASGTALLASVVLPFIQSMAQAQIGHQGRGDTRRRDE